jgi:hypothetical protein
MTVHLRHVDVTLSLPVMPRKFARGDKRNYVRWHCWVEAVRALALHYKELPRTPPPGRRRRGV